MDYRPLGKFLVVLSAFPLGILIYTLINLNALGMEISDASIMLEAFATMVLLALGLWLTFRKT